MPIDFDEVRGQTITDVQKQPYSGGPSSMPAGSECTEDEYVFVLGNGRTLKVCGGKDSTGAARMFARLTKTQQVEDTEVVD